VLDIAHLVDPIVVGEGCFPEHDTTKHARPLVEIFLNQQRSLVRRQVHVSVGRTGSGCKSHVDFDFFIGRCCLHMIHPGVIGYVSCWPSICTIGVVQTSASRTRGSIVELHEAVESASCQRWSSRSVGLT
jgi:hypothetical protein